ncbi:MAG: C69 family dipeptidase [Anaerolineae bacterium]|nr:C69 family dipeptidase [Anaerolineae bacterium]
MCDTLVALGNVTADGSVILAKNSDRPPNEAQVPVYIPRTKHNEATVKCTHIEIPQVSETFGILLSKPFWMWGCEMGVNEFGVAIGNEAVFTKEPKAKIGLLGMDMIRLALERADTARRALDVIVDLLAVHGQGGRCSIFDNMTYHNSFLIADPGDAWVLETAGKYWAAKQVRDVYSISNGITIGSDWDRASPGLVEHAVEKGWCKSTADFDFSRCYSDFLYTRFSECRLRQGTTLGHLQADKPKIAVQDMMRALRDHGSAGQDPQWNPSRGKMSVCAHAAEPVVRSGQSTASLVAHLRADLPTYWMTGTSAPCTGLFKPFHLGPLPPEIGDPAGTYDEHSLWWSHERLHRAVIADYATRMPLYVEERDGLEAAFVSEEDTLYRQIIDADLQVQQRQITELDRLCFDRAAVATRRWTERVRATPIQNRPSLIHRTFWRKQNRTGGITL